MIGRAPSTTSTAVAVAGDATTFAPGRHLVTYTASDTRSNAKSVQQVIDVRPIARFGDGPVAVSEGQSVSLPVVLNGDAAQYPVTLNFTVGGTATPGVDHTLLAGVPCGPSASTSTSAGSVNTGGFTSSNCKTTRTVRVINAVLPAASDTV